ncbi:MAG TPA: HAMP domain-containing sensor histidine kinase [Kineosporiaceae bacterium]|nr:HAMP domain-containing sensor histidine kinase [Kineosporiaceae bacterium]
MRRHLTFLVAASMSAVVLAFLVPLGLLVRTLAEDRAVNAARADAATLGAIALKTDRAQLTRFTAGYLGTHPTGTTTLVLPDGLTLGPALPANDPNLRKAAQQGENVTVPGSAGTDLYVPAIGTQGTAVVHTFIPDEVLHQGVTSATMTLGGLGLLLLVVAVLAADRMARRVSAPIRQVAAAANALHDGLLDTRVPEQGPAEAVAMARALNRLAGRIEQLLAAERDSVADLSHRLRTPVTALRLDADSICDPETAERLRQHVAQLERTVDAIVHDARRPGRAATGGSCDIGRVVQERVSFWSALADDQGRPLRLALPDRPLRVPLDATDLADVIDVLIDNAFAHTDEGVAIEVWVVQRADGAVVLTVEDAGPGLPPGDIVSRGRSGAGSTGLGLDIARRAALATGGRLELGRSRLGGALIRVVLSSADPFPVEQRARGGQYRAGR